MKPRWEQKEEMLLRAEQMAELEERGARAAGDEGAEGAQTCLLSRNLVSHDGRLDGQDAGRGPVSAAEHAEGTGANANANAHGTPTSPAKDSGASLHAVHGPNSDEASSEQDAHARNQAVGAAAPVADAGGAQGVYMHGKQDAVGGTKDGRSGVSDEK
jgi:hypothetical protein